MKMSSNDLGAALKGAIAGGYVAELSAQTYTVSSPIVVNVTSSTQGPLGIDLGGAKIVSQITNGAPVIQINVGPGVDLRYLTLSNFTIEGNGREGAGIKIVADGNERWLYNFNVDNVTVRNVGGYGLDVQGSVFEGLISDSWMIGNGAGGAYFGHSAGGGQVSALRWFGGGLQSNGGEGIFLGEGTRDLSIDGASFVGNNGPGISAEWGVTSVTDSEFRDNLDVGVWFQCFGHFHDNVFSSSGAQPTGISGYITGNVSVIGSSSVYTGSGSDQTVLANLQGIGGAFLSGDTGRIVTGPSVAVAGAGGGNRAEVSVSSQGLSLASLEAITAATTAPVSSSTGTGALEAALRSALSGGTVADLSAASFTVSTPIVINLTTSHQGPIGIDLGGAEIRSQVTNGRPVIEIVVGAGVEIGSLSLSNFLIHGNGSEGAGIKIVADGTDRSVSLDISNVHIEHVGGIGLDAIGNVSGTVFNSWMHGNSDGGARFANSTGGGVAGELEWIGGGFRKNGVAGLILSNGAHDMTVQGAYFVENEGPGLRATSGIMLVEQSGFENNGDAGAVIQGSSAFISNTFSTHGPQRFAVAGSPGGGKVTLMGDSNEYYGSGTDTTALANLQGNGTVAIAGGGKVIVGPNVTVTGASLPTAPAGGSDPTIESIDATGAGIVAGSGALNAGKTVTFTATFSEVVTVAGGTPSLVLNDGGTATYSGGSGTSKLTFSHTVQAGMNAGDLAVSSLALNGASIKDTAGNAAALAGATNRNPAGTLKVDTTAPTVSAISVAGAGISAGNGTVGTGAVVTFTVAMSEAVAVTGTPTLALSNGGTAQYAGGTGSAALTFTHTVAKGQDSADLAVESFAGGTVADTAGNLSQRAGALGYNPPGTLKVDTATGAPAGPAPAQLIKAVNVGGGQVTTSAGIVYAADPGPTTGGAASEVFVNNVGIAGTTDDALYIDERWTPGGSYTYEVPVANGTYRVDLNFAEIYWGIMGPGQRVFDVALEGQALAPLQNVDIYGQVGPYTALTLSQQVTVSDGSLSIQVGPGSNAPGNVENAKLNAFAVFGTGSTTTSPSLSIAAASASKNEGNSGSTAFTFTVDRSGNLAAPSAATWAVTGSGSNAASAADFTGAALPAGTVTFAAGETTKTVTVNVAGDTTVEQTEGFTVSLSSPNGATLGTATAIGSILNDDGSTLPSLSIAAASASKNEGNSGSTAFTFTVTRSGVLTAPSAASWAVAGSGANAAAGTDFAGGTGPTGTVSFAAGEATKTVTVNVAGDTSVEQTEGFTVTLTAPTNATLATATATGSILNDDGAATPGPMPSLSARLATDTGASASDGITSTAALAGSADPYSTVRFSVDGQAIAATATAGASGAWTFAPTGLTDGRHEIAVSATSPAGRGGSASLAFTLDTMAPRPAFTNALAANGKVTLTGTSSAGDRITLWGDNTWLGVATAGQDGTWSLTTAATPNAPHGYSGSGTDLAGNEGGTAGKMALGGSGADSLNGTAGADLIDGRAGNDRLTGGAGADIFAFSTAPHGVNNLDRITDFTSGSDKLSFHRSVFDALPAGNLASANFVQAMAALRPDQHLIYNQTTGIVSYDADGSGSGIAVPVAQLNAGQTLSAQDIRVV